RSARRATSGSPLRRQSGTALIHSDQVAQLGRAVKHEEPVRVATLGDEDDLRIRDVFGNFVGELLADANLLALFWLVIVGHDDDLLEACENIAIVRLPRGNPGKPHGRDSALQEGKAVDLALHD